jgi:hypothetical protein
MLPGVYRSRDCTGTPRVMTCADPLGRRILFVHQQLARLLRRSQHYLPAAEPEVHRDQAASWLLPAGTAMTRCPLLTVALPPTGGHYRPQARVKAGSIEIVSDWRLSERSRCKVGCHEECEQKVQPK